MRLARYVTACLLAAVLCIGACTKYELSDREVEFNSALQDADNRQLLLNTVRASKRYPLFFTQLGQINSTGMLDGSQLAITIPFGPQNRNIYSATPTFKFQEGLTVTTAPLNTQEFFQGFLSPVDAQLFTYYLDYGWNEELIYYTFIREIDLPTEMIAAIKGTILDACEKTLKWKPRGLLDLGPRGEKCLELPNPALLLHVYSPQLEPNHTKCPGLVISAVKENDAYKLVDLDFSPFIDDGIDHLYQAQVFTNSPTEPCEFLKFQWLLEQLRYLHLRGVSLPEKNANADQKVEMKDPKQNFTLTIQPDKTDNQKKKYVLTFDLATKHQIKCVRKPNDNTAASIKYDEKLNNIENRGPLVGADADNPDDTPGCKIIKNTAFIMRSPEGMVFYLGELLNAQRYAERERPSELRALTPTIFVYEVTHPVTQPIFLVNHGDAKVVSVALGDESYYVGGGPESGQSMHVMSLVEQILALQKKGTAAPTIPIVQVLGATP